ncbi:MAG: hypothetical protein ACPGYY_04360 [Bacteroidia bacterium]
MAVAPAIVGGLALLLFQTYSLITGKSFSDINFDIGKLWQTNEVSTAKIDPSNPIQLFRSDFINPQEEFSFISEPFDKKVVAKMPVRDAKLVKTNEVKKKTAERIHSELFEVDIIDEVKIDEILKSKQLIKYFNRLENEYLINPNMVPRQGKWYVGFSFAPTLNYRTFSYDPSMVSGVAVDGNYRYTFGLSEQERNMSDKSITSYTVGIDFGRKISPRLSVYSGLHYAHYGEQIQVSSVDINDLNYQDARFYSEKPSYTLYDKENSSANIPFKNRYSYIEIPIGLSADLIELNKSQISLQSGLVLQKLDNVNALIYDFETDYYYWMNSKKELFRNVGVGAHIGLSASQFIGERLEFYVNPHFKFNLNSTFKKPYPVTQNQYTTGLQLGLKQHLF